MDRIREKPLEGLKVLELGTLIAGPFATRLMAEFGAEVIKVETPGTGDPLRKWRKMHGDTSLWWYVQSRNKKSITINLKDSNGQQIIKDLIRKMDIVVENFRPGTMEKWGLGYEQLKELNPGIIMVRVSGYGQTGPYKDKPGFGSIGEAIGGIRYLTGYPDRPPTRVGISLGDSLAALYAVIGAMMAVYHRDVKGTGQGQYVDVALYEAVFSLMESMVPEFDQFGFIRERTGSTLPGIAPSNTYECKDGKHIVIGANGDAIFKRLMNLIGREDLAKDEKYSSNEKRANHAEFLDEQIEKWTKQHPFQTVMSLLDKAGVPAGPIYNVKDIFMDKHYKEREMIQDVFVKGIGKLKVPGIVPKLSETPGSIEWVGPKIGEHNEEVMKELVGLTEDEFRRLSKMGVF